MKRKGETILSKSKNHLNWSHSDVSEEKIVAKKVIKSMLLMLVLVLGIAAMGVFYINDKLGPVIKDSKDLVEVEIPLNTSVKGISSILKDNNLIKDDKIFYYYLRIKSETNLKAGSYFLTRGMTATEVIEQLKEGKVYAASNKFVVPEGYTVAQIAQKLADKGLVDKKKFLELTRTGNFNDIFITREIPVSNERRNRLEGFLFPKTYEFNEGITEEEIIRSMLKQTEREIPSEWLEEVKNGDISFYEIMVLASIIEREAVAKGERNKIARVYYNRLDVNMLLQADATIQYALGDQKARILYKDLDIESPYNTYRKKGLPPSPIANPGLESIKAAIYPAEHEYLFYVTKKDGTGEHYFSKTYQEHLKNIDKSELNEE